MTMRRALEAVSTAWGIRLTAMPDTTAAQRSERRLIAQFINDLVRVLEDYKD